MRLSTSLAAALQPFLPAAARRAAQHFVSLHGRSKAVASYSGRILPVAS